MMPECLKMKITSIKCVNLGRSGDTWNRRAPHGGSGGGGGGGSFSLTSVISDLLAQAPSDPPGSGAVSEHRTRLRI